MSLSLCTVAVAKEKNRGFLNAKISQTPCYRAPHMGGDVTGTTSAAATTAAGGDLAEPQYVGVKTSVWWDIENCHVPKGCDPHAIAQNISSALVQLNYSGPVFISAYGDTNRIPASVQQALSSTGIGLNHVPAGVKDASDKKILVDMLFWAVDNAAPANYLLISGDRDFSNALHQLRMRRYNILLAQPQKASAALVAAAKSVWLWTSLSVGGPPLSSGESSEFTNSHVSYNSAPETVNNSKPSVSSVANQNSSTIGSNRDKKSKVTYARKTPNQPSMSRASSASTITSQESKKSSDPDQLDHAQAKPFKKAPHEFFVGSEPADSASKSNISLIPSNCELSGSNENSSMGVSQSLHLRSVRPNNFPQQPTFMQDNLLPPSSQNHGFQPMPPRAEGLRYSAPASQSMLDIGKLNISEYPNYSQHAPNFQHRNGKEFKTSSIELPNQPIFTVQQKNHVRPGGQAVQHNPFNQKYYRGPDFLPPSSSMVGTAPKNGIWGTQSPPPSEYVQGLIGIILLALNTLKNEKIVPIEANISDCIRYGDLKKNINVRKALDLAVEQRMVVKQNIGSVQMYIGSNDKLWNCVNTIGGDPIAYPKTTWDKIQKFLTSSDGKFAILASECRYEAALALKNACLQELALGDVLQILSMIVTVKKWIINHPSGWQPITITVEE